MQIDDLALEKAGINLDVYFDTHDVIETVLGLQAFYDGARFDLQKIFHENEPHPFQDVILVQCLLMSGRLGAIKVLPPHQAEFRKLMDVLDGTEARLSPEQIGQRFLREVCRAGTVKYETLSLEALSNEELIEYVRRSVGSAVNLFKTTQLIDSGTWRQRLAKLRSEKILHFIESHQSCLTWNQ